MFRRIGRSTTFANVCSLLALTIAVGTGGAYAANTVFSTDIVDGEVKHADLAGSSVTSTNIYNGSVLNAEIGANAVDGSKILDSTIAAVDLGSNSVGSSEIATDAVQASEVAAGSIDSDELADGLVGNVDLGTNSVSSAKIADGAVTNAKLGGSSVDSSKIASDTITAFDIAGGEANGAINLGAGFVANGRCRDFNIAVGGAKTGDAVLFSVNTALPEGIVLTGVRVNANDNVIGKACNLSGAAFPQLSGIQVEIVTITI
jgi:hypothetical protein